MLCERCGKNTAEVHIRQAIQGVVSEHHLCKECARELTSGWKPGSNFLEFSIGSFLENLCKTLGPEPQEQGKATRAVPTCPRCGLDFEGFRKTGRFGCAECYRAFREWIRPLFTRIHGSETYRGPAPGQGTSSVQGMDDELERLKIQLKEAVSEERYEMAATLRDRIRILEGRLRGERG
ncbi:MAG: excinuclease ABC subunit B [Synergistaceae bacterium]|nr:excinuclease ABC subunit B [Synergistaceae bacterium]